MKELQLDLGSLLGDLPKCIWAQNKATGTQPPGLRERLLPLERASEQAARKAGIARLL